MFTLTMTKVTTNQKEEIVYGLKHTDGTVMEDISPDKSEVERLAEYFNEHGLSSVHLRDVVTDMVDSNNGLAV